MVQSGAFAPSDGFYTCKLILAVRTCSVSVLQWLCNADKASNSPTARISAFFNTLFASLTRGARAVFQFYPESDDQVSMLMSSATRAGFSGGLVVDYPNSKKAKKFYLCLMSGPSAQGQPAPRALGTAEKDEVAFERKREKGKKGAKGARNKNGVDKDWILKKKSLYRQRGKEGVPNDSKWVTLLSHRRAPGLISGHDVQIHWSQTKDEVLAVRSPGCQEWCPVSTLHFASYMFDPIVHLWYIQTSLRS